LSHAVVVDGLTDSVKFTQRPARHVVVTNRRSSVC